ASSKKPGVLEPPPPVLRPTGSVSEHEFIEIEAIKLLIQSYFNIVKRTVVDMVPKYIMLNLVNHSRQEIQNSLLAEFYRDEGLEELLQESPETTNRRRECKEMIKALQKADEIVAS